MFCAPNLPGAKILRDQQDEFSNFWYQPSQRGQVAAFYKTCVPTCADDADSYHSSKDMCLVANDIARVWLQGNGQHCQHQTAGAVAIRHASREIGDGNSWYKPEMAGSVKAFYRSCSATCAKGDLALDADNCQVQNALASTFLEAGANAVVCDSISPGRSALTLCPADLYDGLCDGSSVYWYRRSHGQQVVRALGPVLFGLASAGMLCAHQQTIETTDAARHAGGGLVHFMHAESYGGARASAAATAHTAQAAGTPSMTSHAVLLTGLYE